MDPLLFSNMIMDSLIFYKHAFLNILIASEILAKVSSATLI